MEKGCLGLSQCYLQRWERRGWDRCLRWLAEFLQRRQTPKLVRRSGSLRETWRCQTPMRRCRRHYLERQTRIRRYLLVPLVGLSLLSGCSTFSSSQPSVQFGQVSHSLPSLHPKIKNPSSSYGDSSSSQAEQTSQQQSRRDTSLWSASPLWEQ